MWRESIAILVLAAAAAAQNMGPPQVSSMQDLSVRPALPDGVKDVGIDQKLDSQVPLDAVFKDEFGRTVPLSTYFRTGKPVLLALVYYQCPMLCTQILNGVERSLRAVSFNPGRDFEVVALSFDPSDTPELASQKKANHLKRYGRPDTANGWHFLTGAEPEIRKVTDAVGFRYRYDKATRQFAHASGIMILTPQGKVSRYFYGVEYAPRDVRLGLVEASSNHIGSPVDKVLLFCYHYDPATGKYGAIAMNMVRFAGAAFALIAGAFLVVAWRRDFRRDGRPRRTV